MLQVIDSKQVYVVEFDTMPELPITGLVEGEVIYEKLLSWAKGFRHHSYDPYCPNNGLYAQALTAAIKTGVITEPGKYGIWVNPRTREWAVYNITEGDT